MQIYRNGKQLLSVVFYFIHKNNNNSLEVKRQCIEVLN